MKKSINKINAFIIILAVVLALYTISLIVPLVWAGYTSFKDYDADFYYNVLGLPQKWMFSNYSKAFANFTIKVRSVSGGYVWVGFGEMLLNSLLYSLGASFFGALIPCIVGYAMAKFDFKFSKFLYTYILVMMALPVVGALASEIEVVRTLGIYDSIYGIWLMRAHFATSYTLVFYASFKSIPKGYSEAAEIDGASEWTVMTRVIMPLVIKTFGAIMLILFIRDWNEYETAIIYLPTHPTIAYGLWAFNGISVHGMNGVPMKLTGCMILFIPILILFIIFQDKLMGNVSMGGLKG